MSSKLVIASQVHTSAGPTIKVWSWNSFPDLRYDPGITVASLPASKYGPRIILDYSSFINLASFPGSRYGSRYLC